MDQLITRGSTTMYGYTRRFTLVGIVDEEEVRIGLSTCSEKNQFNKKVGNKIAEHRAFKRPIKTMLISELPEEAGKNTKQRVINALVELRDAIANNPLVFHKPYDHHEMSTTLS